jgi:protein-tyrosine phosphatase
MSVQPYWINSRFAIIPRPRGSQMLDYEMQAVAKAGVNVVVSLLPEIEAAKLGLAREAEAAAQAGLDFVSFPIPDGELPADKEQFHVLLATVAEMLANGKRVGIHCRASIGRSSVAAASVLIRAGIPSATAWKKVEDARQFPVPDTQEQRDWVDQNISPAA